MGIRKPFISKKAEAVKPLPETFIVIDFETTGLDPVKDRIIEIGAVRFTKGDPVAIFNTLVKQDPILYPISQQMVEATGHTPEDIAKGMEQGDAIMLLLDFIRSLTIAGQNVLFDFSFFYSALDELGINDRVFDLLDTLTIGRDRKPYPHRLPNLCAHYGVEQGQWHSAYFDALATGELLLAMHREDKDYAEGKQVMDYVNVIGYKRQYGEPAWVPGWVTLKGQGTLNIKEGK